MSANIKLTNNWRLLPVKRHEHWQAWAGVRRGAIEATIPGPWQLIPGLKTLRKRRLPESIYRQGPGWDARFVKAFSGVLPNSSVVQRAGWGAPRPVIFTRVGFHCRTSKVAITPSTLK